MDLGFRVRNFPAGSTAGFVLTLIPKAEFAPLQVTGKGLYYIRAGSSFSPAPHGVLAGLFGRRPAPMPAPTFTVGKLKLEPLFASFKLGINIVNAGQGIARDVFMTLQIRSIPPGPASCDIIPMRREWASTSYSGYHTSFISDRDYRLPPGCLNHIVDLEFKIRIPCERDLLIEGRVGAEGAGGTPFYIKSTAENLNTVFHKLGHLNAPSEEINEKWREFVVGAIEIHRPDIDK